MPFSLFIALCILPVLASTCFYPRRRLLSRRRARTRKSRFGFYPLAAASALLVIQTIVRPSAMLMIETVRNEECEEDDSANPNDPLQHLHRQAAKIRRGEPIDRLTTLLPKPPSSLGPSL